MKGVLGIAAKSGNKGLNNILTKFKGHLVFSSTAVNGQGNKANLCAHRFLCLAHKKDKLISTSDMGLRKI